MIREAWKKAPPFVLSLVTTLLIGSFFGVFLCATTATASVPYSPYYQSLLPQRNGKSPCRILDSITYEGKRISLFTKGTSQFGVEIAPVGRHEPSDVETEIVQSIDRRLLTARESVFDDGLVFEYWTLVSVDSPIVVVFGYTSDKRVHRVLLRLASGTRATELHEGRYFFTVLRLGEDSPMDAQGVSGDGRVLRTWNRQSSYPARRTWLSLFVQSYPYVVSSTKARCEP